MRSEKIMKAGQLTVSWKLMRECKNFLEKNSDALQERTREETARIREEEKLERLEIIKFKKKRAQKADLSKEETKKLKGRTKTLLEMAEIKPYLRRSYRENGKMTQPTVKGKSSKKDENVQQAGRSGTAQPSGISSKTGGKEQGRASGTANHEKILEERQKKNQEIQPAGKQTVSEYFENERMKKKWKMRQLGESLRLMREYIKYLEESEPWLIASRL